MKKIWFLALFFVSTAAASELKEIEVPEIRSEFRVGKTGMLAKLSDKNLQLSKASKLYPEFNKFSPPRSMNWKLDYDHKQRDLQAKAKQDKEFTGMLRDLDTTQKTEYFRKVLRSPLPQSFKGDPKHNPEQTRVMFFSIN